MKKFTPTLTRVWIDRSFLLPIHLPREFYFALPLPLTQTPKTGTHWVWAERDGREECIATLDETLGEQWAFPINEWLDDCRQFINREPQKPGYLKIPWFNINWVPAKTRDYLFQTFFNQAQTLEPRPEMASGIDALVAAAIHNFPATQLNAFKAPSWPDKKSAALIFTMDVDSPYIFSQSQNLLRQKLDRLNLKSAWYFLTGRYRLDHAFIDELQHAGHEIGWHGHNHDHRLGFLRPSQIAARVQQARYFLERYDVKGMRTENFLWSRELFRQVRHVIRYDASTRDSFPMVEDGFGSGTTIPFQTKERIWELPTTITGDHCLPQQWSNERRLALLIEQIDRRIALGGVIHFVYHPEPDGSLTGANQALFDGLLEYLETKLPLLWHCLPVELYEFVAHYERAKRLAARPNPTLGQRPATQDLHVKF